jgi:hypothetical protein
MASGARIVAIGSSVPRPQFGQVRMSMSWTLRRRSAQRKPGRGACGSGSPVEAAVSAAACVRRSGRGRMDSGPCGTTIAHSFAFGARRPWRRIRCRRGRGRGTSAARRSIQSIGVISRWVVPSCPQRLELGPLEFGRHALGAVPVELVGRQGVGGHGTPSGRTGGGPKPPTEDPTGGGGGRSASRRSSPSEAE